MKPRFLASAEQEFIDASNYYASENLWLVKELEREIDRALEYLCVYPQSAALIDAVHHSYKLHRFPYCLIYRVEGDEIVVVALAHSARRPGYWYGAGRED